MGLRICITGSKGFIGYNFVELLREKNKEISKKLKTDGIEVQEFEGDIRNEKDVEDAVKNCDILFHLAAQSFGPKSIEKPKLFIDVNIFGTFNILEAMRKFPIKKMVYISSAEIYGSSDLPSEESEIMPKTPYTASKAAADMLCYSYFCTYKLPLVILRLGNQYGPRQFKEKLIPNLITNVLSGKPMQIMGGKQTRCYTYIYDTLDAFLRVLSIENIDGEAFNISSSFENSIIDMGKKIEKLMKEYDPKMEMVEQRIAEIQRLSASSKKAEKVLGWKASTPLEEGLKKTIKWYKENEEFWK